MQMAKSLSKHTWMDRSLGNAAYTPCSHGEVIPLQEIFSGYFVPWGIAGRCGRDICSILMCCLWSGWSGGYQQLVYHYRGNFHHFIIFPNILGIWIIWQSEARFGFILALTFLNSSRRAIGGMTAGDALWVVITLRYSKILSTLASAAPKPSCNLKTAAWATFIW